MRPVSSPSSEKSTSKPASVVIDPSGDIDLVLPTTTEFCYRGASSESVTTLPAGTISFRVCSYLLCMASSVFRAILDANPLFQEAKSLAALATNTQISPLDINLSDDDPKALAILLWAMHHQWEIVPRTLSFSELYLLAVVCDKYNMRQVLSLCLEQFWVPQHVSMAAKKGGEKWLFMSYAFGLKDLFEKISRKIILESHPVADGECGEEELKRGDLVINGGDDFVKGVPENIIAAIKSTRQRTINSSLEAAHELLERYQSREGTQCIYDLNPIRQRHRDQCDYTVFGQLYHLFSKAGIQREDPGMFLKMSILNVQGVFEGLDIPQYSVVCCTKSCFGKGRCGNCKSSQDLTVGIHRDTCNPMPAFRNTIKTIIENVRGLKYDDYIV